MLKKIFALLGLRFSRFGISILLLKHKKQCKQMIGVMPEKSSD